MSRNRDKRLDDDPIIKLSDSEKTRHPALMKVLSPAKINLFLQVTGKRPDGYHELFSLMCCVSLCDTIFLQFDTTKIEIDSSHPTMPLDENNLAYQAADLFFKTLNIKAGVKIGILKQIPLAAGLGGGSSNAASVLRGLNHHYGRPLSLDRLMVLGLKLGADVPFLLYQKPALASGIGDILEAYTQEVPDTVVIVYPGFAVSTAAVFQNLNLRLTKCKKIITRPSLKKSGYQIPLHLCNDLEAVTESRHPEIKAVKQHLIQLGAMGVLMSGSGPSVFGLFAGREAANNAIRAIKPHPRWIAFGVEIIREKYPL
jgi:4-diphosphocytidyl-2-C-methyl-D-erythritol kinase